MIIVFIVNNERNGRNSYQRKGPEKHTKGIQIGYFLYLTILFISYTHNLIMEKSKNKIKILKKKYIYILCKITFPILAF